MNSLRCAAVGFAVLTCLWPAAHSQAPGVRHKLEPIAETKLLMDGLAKANFRGLERLLSEGPRDDQAWQFARGQALLLAETGNLLMLRPPKMQGIDAWFDRATDLRQQGTKLALAVAARDLAKSRLLLHEVAGSCNRCHQTFRIPVQIEAPAPVLPAPGSKVQKVSAEPGSPSHS